MRPICDTDGGGGAWSRDGTIVFGGSDGGLSRVPASGGRVEPLARLDRASKATSYRFPSFLPDGRRFLFSAYPLNQIWLGSLDSGETRALFAADSQAQFVEPGRIVFARQGTLFAQPFDAARAVMSGEAVPIEASVMSDANGYHAFSLSESGQLAYRAGRLVETTQLTWVDRSGRVVGVAGQPGYYRNPALSRDDARVAVEVTDSSQRSQDIWLLELARNVLSRFTFDDGNDVMPVWSPDGATVVFGSDRRGGITTLYRKATDMASPETLLQKTPTERSVPYSWSPDGRFVLHRYLINNFYNTGVFPLKGDGTSYLYAERGYMLANATVSPDGRLLAYNANDSGRFEVFVESFPTPGARYQVSRDGGVHPRWSRDGREVFYYAPDGQLMAAPISSGSTPPVRAAVPLFRARLLNGPAVSVGFAAQYDVASDGRFLLNMTVADTAPPVIHVVLNWTAGLGL